MTKQSKKAITITQVRKATEEELAALKPSPTDKYHAEWVIGIDHLSEFGSKARAFFPTHNFEVTKKYREDLFNSFYKPKALNERGIKGLRTTEKDLEDIRRLWLNDELKLVDKWMNIPHMSLSDRHELNKYQDYVQSELTPKAGVINPAPELTEKNTSRVEGESIAPAKYYGFYQYVNELILVPQIRMPKYPDGHWAKDKIIKLAEEYYHFKKGVNFYNAFKDWTGVKIPNGVRLMKPRSRMKLKEYTFAIAKSLNDSEYIDWWNNNFPER